MLKHNRHNRWVHTHTCPHCGPVLRSHDMRMEQLQSKRVICAKCKQPAPLKIRLRRAGNIAE